MTGPRRPLHGGRPEVGQHPVDEDVRRELDFHIEMRSQELIAEGWEPAAAHQEARRLFGDMRELEGECVRITASQDRSVRLMHRVDALRQDLRYAFRTLKAAPGFTLVAIVTLALGLGANTAVFSVVNSVLLKPLPYAEPDALVWLSEWRTTAGRGMNVAEPNVLDWRDQSRTVASMARFQGGPTTVLGGEEPMRLYVTKVGEEFWEVFPVRPVVGRTTVPDEHANPPAAVALLREDVWRARFGARDIGEIYLDIGGVSHAVVGVLPADFAFPADAQVWRPANSMGGSRTAHNWRVVGRLADGATLEQADAELDAIQGRIAAASDEDPEYMGDAVQVVSLQDRIVGPSRTPLLLLLGAAALVLLIACSNLASTLLARGAGRVREMAIRSSLGAGRRRLVRQLMTEALVLAVAGGVAGMVVAQLSVQALKALAPPTLPRLDEIAVDPGALAFMAFVVVGTGVLFGLLPALRLARPEVAQDLRSGGRGNSVGSGKIWGTLVAAEVALAVVLLVGSGLLLRSFQRVVNVDQAFRTEGVVTTPVDLSPAKYRDSGDYAVFFAELVRELEATPEIDWAGVTTALPVSGSPPDGRMELDGDLTKYAVGHYVAASPGYFGAVGIDLLEGRIFGDGDGFDDAHVAVVSQRFADTYWPGESALGKQVSGGGMDNFWEDGAFATVVGIVEDVRYNSLTDPPEAVVYFPASQRPYRLQFHATLVGGSLSGASEQLVAPTRSTIRRLDSDVPMTFRSMDDYMSAAVQDRRFLMALFAAFAGLAFVLAVVGIYGVVSYSVARRTREMGVRIALGAEPGQVRTLVMKGALRPVIWGSAAGVLASLALSGVLEALLFGVGAKDPVTFVGVAAALLLAGAAASILPARRSTKVDPMVTMRAE